MPTQSIRFVWEQFAGRRVKDLCPFDPTAKYIFNISSCGDMQFEEVNSYFSQIPGYDAGVEQNLTHDDSGILTRVTPN